MENDFEQELTVSILRSVLVRLRRLYPGVTVEGAIGKAVEEVASGRGGAVLLSQSGVRELCSILNVRSVNSEKDILAAARERFNVGPNTVQFDLDPNVAVSVREVADANDEPFGNRVREYIQVALDQGYFEQRHELNGLYFTKEQWRALTVNLNGKLSAENVVAAVEHWKRLMLAEQSESAVAAQ